MPGTTIGPARDLVKENKKMDQQKMNLAFWLQIAVGLSDLIALLVTFTRWLIGKISGKPPRLTHIPYVLVTGGGLSILLGCLLITYLEPDTPPDALSSSLLIIGIATFILGCLILITMTAKNS